ncbi:helix-turn-helix domain-containing protein [Stenotrophomonas sp. HITSZ_GD]|uniref:helix-turn-helix domain-containing protein n=1 Tax=Stenotrophomonas sp. HITSZ_GD TaxID=3037248 RepID=UPI00240D37A3|nr:helix-turn-helix domain-containing protein [Stenotrophomonas sp. HITSZ_GD]MDG2526576.1 helix-turn-helix domain-containing protein [Stenotrophomonas sp. HITSZ_GD]
MHSASKTQGQVHARSISDAAKSIGIGRSTLYELISANAIRAFKVGKRTLIAESELQRFVAERTGFAA